MNKNIEMAIASLCDDITTNTDATENSKRAEAVLTLYFSNIFAPDSEEEFYEDEPSEENCTKNPLPKAGEHFEYNGIEFVALGEEQGGILAVVAELAADDIPFDKNRSNDWRKSTLRKFLNEEYIKKFNRGDLLQFVSDLTSDDGMKDYGTSEDFIALLSDNLYRKYRENFPKYGTWVWSITPYSCLPSGAYYERVVDTDGSLSSSNAHYGSGIPAACIFNPSIFE